MHLRQRKAVALKGSNALTRNKKGGQKNVLLAVIDRCGPASKATEQEINPLWEWVLGVRRD